jgi:hypothetical protein
MIKWNIYSNFLLNPFIYHEECLISQNLDIFPIARQIKLREVIHSKGKIYIYTQFLMINMNKSSVQYKYSFNNFLKI